MERLSDDNNETGKKYCVDSSKAWGIIESSSKSKDEENKQFFIQHIPEDRYEEAVDFLSNYYIADEPLCQSININDDPVGLEDFRREWRETLHEGISVGAFLLDNDSHEPPLIGLNVLYVGTKTIDDGEMEKKIFNSSRAKKLIEMFIRVRDEADIYNKYETESYLGAIGLVVHPRYRGLGIAKYLLDARTRIGRELGIPVTVTIFTGRLSQLAAERTGFEVLFEQRYDEMLNDHGQVMYPVKESKVIKVMGKKLY